MKNFVYIGLIGILLMLVSCATVDYSFVNIDAKAAKERKVAIFPFANNIDDYAILRVSKTKDASAFVSNIFINELICNTNYEVIPPYEVDEKLSLNKEKSDWIYKSFLGDLYERMSLTTERLNKLGTALGADAILVGEVTDFSRYQQDGVLYTGVGLNIRMVDVASGQVLWEARDKIKEPSIITHSYSTLEANSASYPVVRGGVDKEPKYATGQGYFYGLSGDFPYHVEYKDVTVKLCKNIISTLKK